MTSMTAIWVALLALAVGCWPSTPRPLRATRAGRVGHSAIQAQTRRWHLPTLDRRRQVAVALASGVAAGLVLPAHAALCVGVVAWLVVSTWQRTRSRKAAFAEAGRDGDTLFALASELRAGHDLASGLRSAADGQATRLGRAMVRAANAIDLGEHPADALERAGGDGLVGQLAGLLRLAATEGVALAEAVEALATDCVDRARQRGEVSGLLAGPRATAHLLAGLPIFGIVMGEGIGAKPLDTLLHTSAGAIAMVAGVVLAVVGVLWTQVLAARAES